MDQEPQYPISTTLRGTDSPQPSAARDRARFSKHVFICTNERPTDNPKSSCARCGGRAIRLRFVQLIRQQGLQGNVRANKSGCLDACELGAVVVIYPANLWYTGVKLDDVDEIFATSILGEGVVERLAAQRSTWEELRRLRIAGRRKGE